MTRGGVLLLGPDTARAPGLGGKGSSLARMVAGGCPVPPTAVIDADAYRRLLDDPVLAAHLERLSSSGEPPVAEEVDAAFLRTAVPDDLAEQIVAVARSLGPRVAVRSSGSSEDLPDQSFAGQYRSFLDVPTDADEVVRAVRLVWASLWHPAPWSYRRAWGVPDADASMAVVLMAMVPAREAGVAFTADPGGHADQMRIEVVEGLGEALVSGQRTPTVWLVPRDVDQPLPDGAQPHLATVRRLAAAREAVEGVALDIEWAWDGERVWLVQSRPVTVTAAAGDGFDTPVDDHELTAEGIGEMLPGVLPPLQWSVASFLVEEAFRSVLGGLGALPDAATGPHRFIRRVRGRAALDLEFLKAAAASIPGASGADIERQYFGESAAPASPPARQGRMRLLRRDLRAAAARRQARFQGDVVIEAVAGIREDFPDLAGLTDDQLLTLRFRLLHLGVRAMTAELGVAASAVAAYGRLEQVLGRHLPPDEAARWAQRVTRGAALPPAPAPGASRSVFAGPSWDEDGRRAAGAPDDQRVRAAHRPAGGPLPGPRRTAGGPDAPGGTELEALLASDPRWQRTRILSGQLVDVRLHLLRRMVADAVDDLGRREQVKAAVLELGGAVRRIHLELGRRLVQRGILAGADDVDLLGDEELRRAVRDGQGVARGLLGRRRRWLANRGDDDLLPSRFLGVPVPAEVPVPAGDRWPGLAASPGRYTGTAVVVSDPTREHPPAGSVIVARATDAAWSPLFLDAGAIVVERGGRLSHAAIVARELGVPAVLDVQGATKALGGHVVTVDGDRGVVVVHDGDAAEPGAGVDQAVAT